MPATNRRTVLQGIGLGGAATLAGCSTRSAPKATQTQKAMNKQKQQTAKRVAAAPTDIPDPISRNESKEVDVTLRPEEVTAEVEDGVTFNYMTYNGQVPGPMIRVRKGDTVNLTFENPAENDMPHNVDFHAAAGPGGGAEATMTAPGETAHLKFEATYPGAYIYHCAVPNMDMHISAGMFGIILVEPEEGLPEVDHEFYFGQHEIYTDKRPGEKGQHNFDIESMKREEPTYVVMNGEKYACTPDKYGAGKVQTGDTARVFFVTGGPNLTSSFHPIGNVWEKLWPEGSLTTKPQTHIQTKQVAPGSTTVATMGFPVPGAFKLVDHSLTRVARKGCMAIVAAEGEENPEVFDPEPKQ
ncbi:copper-containing nitrite reductase [Halorussus gelatinilyticus]|uniref:Copper-containing nitrite reductase n=1 Tax=Halorussus gelatinilyticus TaxID=2937524 RepID=A0A8U0ILA1_9EURY|nr:copper-containing nitrite reductase [Halorussus gelatinilyticus]UPW01391.1 copper-containing nitrite reductase [Halorussus gelatinilyticus]